MTDQTTSHRAGHVPAVARDTYGASTGLTPEQLHTALERARVERARAAAAFFDLLGGAVARVARSGWHGLRAVAGGVSRYRRRREAHAALLQMDRHLLLDAGLRPEQVQATVDGLLSRPDPARGSRAPTTGPTPAACHAAQRLAA